MDIRMITDGKQKMEITGEILDDLPEWFGIDEAKQEYVNESEQLKMWVAYVEEEAVGFITLKQHFQMSGEVYVMGVKKAYHRQQIGTLLMETLQDWCKTHAVQFLQVKTLSDASNDAGYAKTRAFYHACGFVPLEVFVKLWDEWNPCLVMVKKLD